MTEWLAWFAGHVSFETAAKAAALLLALGVGCVLVELVRYIRTLRRDKELAFAERPRAELRAVPPPPPPPPPPPQPPSQVAPVAVATRRRRDGILMQAVRTAGALSLMLVLAAAVALPFLGELLETQDAPERADAIVVLASGRSELQKAAELYKQGYATRIVLGRLNETPSPAAAVAATTTGAGADDERQQRMLEQQGIPPAVTTLLTADHSSLVDAAMEVRRIVENRRVKIILVTMRAHSRRARMVFEDAMPRARVVVVLPEEGRIGVPWWSDQKSSLVTVTEAMRFLHYWTGERARLQRAIQDAESQSASR